MTTNFGPHTSPPWTSSDIGWRNNLKIHGSQHITFNFNWIQISWPIFPKCPEDLDGHCFPRNFATSTVSVPGTDWEIQSLSVINTLRPIYFSKLNVDCQIHLLNLYWAPSICMGVKDDCDMIPVCRPQSLIGQMGGYTENQNIIIVVSAREIFTEGYWSIEKRAICLPGSQKSYHRR